MSFPTDETALANRQTVRDLVAVYERAAADIRDAFALLDRAEKSLSEAFGGDGLRSVTVEGKHGRLRPNWACPEDSLEVINRQVWERLIDRLEVKRFMSIEAAEKLDNQIEHDELPPITMEAIEAMVGGFQRQAPDMLQDAIREVFEFLRPHGDRYKRNSQFEIPKRVALEYMVESGWGGKLHILYPSYGPSRDQQLIALENVLNSLDGKGTVHKTHHSDIYNALEQQGPVGETELFRYRACKNRSLHLEFKRSDLLARLNQIAGGMRLKGAKAA